MRRLALMLLLTAACRTSRDAARPDLARLVHWMTGTFSSREQATADPDHFAAIRLVMVPIWEERGDGPWLYVEQAAEDSLEKPYRQRVYRLVLLDDGSFRVDVYALPGDPLRFAAAWAGTGLAAVKPKDLTRRRGCTIFLRAEGVNFVGGTRGRACESSLSGAAYATSTVTITAAALVSWDRGYDAEDRLVWGPNTGGYRFVHTSNRAPPGP